jgi:hypothetical protein
MSYEEDFEVKLHFPAVCIEIKLDFVRNYQFQRCAALQPVHTPAAWSLKIPPRVHFFLWLLTQNKVVDAFQRDACSVANWNLSTYFLSVL